MSCARFCVRACKVKGIAQSPDDPQRHRGLFDYLAQEIDAIRIQKTLVDFAVF